MTVRVLADFHHHALYESHRLTMEDRFGWEVYRPIGMAWFEGWFWNFERSYWGDAVAHQYLDPWDGDAEDPRGFSTRPDRKNPGRDFRMVTLEQARSVRWDLVISSVPANDHGFHSFSREVGAAHAVHIGNQWQETEWGDADCGIVTSTGISCPVPHAVVHQEFSRELFRYVPFHGGEPTYGRTVRSFVNCFPETPEYPRFLKFAEAAPEFDFEVYGSYGSAPPDGFARGDIEATPDVAARMRESFAVWHAKYWSDGFGHAIHNAFALGRPVFGSSGYYAGKMAGPLWVEGVTSFDVDSLGPQGVADTLRRLRGDSDAHRRMCESAAARFDEVVDFDADAGALRAVLEGVMR